MLALRMYRALVHEACGGFLPDTVGEKAADRYVAELPIRCERCTVRMEAIAAHLKSDHAPHPEALLWPVDRR